MAKTKKRRRQRQPAITSDPVVTRDSVVARILADAALVQAVLKECGIKRQAIHQWRRVPTERVLVIEKLTGIPRHEIRPDIYPPPDVPVPEGSIPEPGRTLSSAA